MKSKLRNKSCKKKWHVIFFYCYKLQDKNKAVVNLKGKQLMNSSQVNVVEDDRSDCKLLTISNESKPFEECVLDYGCTFHMCPDRDWFSTYETESKGAVLMGMDALYKIAGVGTIRIKLFDGIVRTLGDVKHVPDLKRNLISLSTLNSNGYKYTGEGGALKVSKGDLVVMKGHKRTANLYIFCRVLQLQVMLLWPLSL